MYMFRSKILPLVLLVLLLVFGSTQVVLGDTSQDVTITGTPSYIAISNAPGTWTINGITGTGVMAVDTIYYTNPLGDTTSPSATVVDGECRFTLTNTSSIATDLTLNVGDFSGGPPTMTNSDDGSNGATTFGSYGYFSGMTYAAKVVAKKAASAELKDNLSATTNIKWGIQLETRTNAWDAGTAITSTATISAAAHS